MCMCECAFKSWVNQTIRAHLSHALIITFVRHMAILLFSHLSDRKERELWAFCFAALGGFSTIKDSRTKRAQTIQFQSVSVASDRKGLSQSKIINHDSWKFALLCACRTMWAMSADLVRIWGIDSTHKYQQIADENLCRIVRVILDNLKIIDLTSTCGAY